MRTGLIIMVIMLVLALPQRPTTAALFSASDAASLVNAINAANAAPDPDIIALTGDITLTAAIDFTNGANGLPSVTSPITLEGGGYTIRGTGGFRLFHVAVGGTLTLNTVTLSGGQANAGGGQGNLGGGILNNGILNITGSTLSNNIALVSGGAVANGNQLTVTNSTFNNNRADTIGTAGGALYFNLGTNGTVLGTTFTNNQAPNGQGGAILSGAVNLVISDSTFTANTAQDGGGVYATGGPAAQIVNSTFSGNTATNSGGGVNGNAAVTNSTFSGNTAVINGGGIAGGTVIANSTFFGNTAAAGGGVFGAGTLNNSISVNNTGGDCAGVGAGVTNRSLDGSCPGVLVLDGVIGLLADNGGATLTHYPGNSAAAGSAIDNAPTCPPPAADQRGVPRDWDGNSDGTPVCDIGAVELSADLPFLDFDFDITDLVEDPPGTATVNIRLTFPAPGPIQVFFKITGTATTGLDYTVTGLDNVYSLVIPAGATTAAFRITSINDGIEEPVENLALEMAFVGPARRVTSGAGATRTLAVIRERPTPPPPQPAPPIPTAVGTFTPSILKAGFVRGAGVEWVISVSNPGPGAGQNLVITDVLPPEYRIDQVEASAGSVSISGQTMTVSIPTLAAGDTAQVTIFSTLLGAGGGRNVACLRAGNMAGERCAEGQPVRALPSTGEAPLWRWMLVVMAASGAVMLACLFALLRRMQALRGGGVLSGSHSHRRR